MSTADVQRGCIVATEAASAITQVLEFETESYRTETGIMIPRAPQPVWVFDRAPRGYWSIVSRTPSGKQSPPPSRALWNKWMDIEAPGITTCEGFARTAASAFKVLPATPDSIPNGAWLVWAQLPTVSADGKNALFYVAKDIRVNEVFRLAAGRIYHFEKRDGQWRQVGSSETYSGH